MGGEYDFFYFLFLNLVLLRLQARRHLKARLLPSDNYLSCWFGNLLAKKKQKQSQYRLLLSAIFK